MVPHYNGQATKAQATAYIRKQGKFEEVGEIILAEYNIGEIVSNQGARNDLDRIGCYINEGWTPQEIMNVSLSYRKYDKIIKDAYFAKRNAETPFPVCVCKQLLEPLCHGWL